MAGSLVAVGAVYYVVQATASDGDLLDLDNIELSQSSLVVATDPDTGAQVEYATLRSSNSHRVWADLEQLPTNLQYAFICTEDKDFYSEPGVNFKRTIGAMINEYLLPIYSSKQGASTLEQQLIKNLTSDKSASGIEGALRKLREIYRALILSRSYSKETILEAYLNTISFTGTIQGVQTAANEYFDKAVSELTLWECASIASITKNPTNYNPYTNPENLINRRNFLLYNMWQQGVISEDDYRNAAAQPLVLAETDNTKKSSSTTSYFTDALFNEVVKDIMAKEGVDESTAQSMLYTGGYTIEATVNPKIQTAMENLMLNTDDAYFPAGWHEEEVTSISDDDVQVYNEDGTPKTRTGDDGTVYYYRNVRTQAAMVTLDYDGNVIAMVGGLGEKTKSLSLNRAYGVTRQPGSTIKPIGAYALGIEYGLVNWSTMLNNSPLYLKQDMVIRDEDYCRRNGLMGLTDKQLKAYPNAWRSWPRNYGGNYGDGSDLPLWNGLARSLNTIAIRVGDLVGANNIFNFVYNTLQLSTLDPVNDVGLAQMVMGSQTHGVTPMALAAAFRAKLCQIYTDVDGVYTADPRIVPNARHLDEITYDEMLELASQGAGVLHNRSVELAKKFRVDLEVLSSLERKPGTKEKEVTKVEKTTIAGVAKDTSIARIALIGLRHNPGVAFQVFDLLSKHNINVDLILQSIGREDSKDISFTVHEKDLEDAQEISKKAQVGDMIHVEIKSKEFGRIATQNAKNVILQKIREEERRVIYHQ